MASSRSNWLVLQERLEQGDPSFVSELRKFDDADQLKAFAPKWHADSRLQARRLLMAYLDQPLNAYRHEPLVKRLFKLAEAAGDDELMACFLVQLDRSLRRRRRKQRRHVYESRLSQQAAQNFAAQWTSQGATQVTVNNWGADYYASAHFEDEVLSIPAGTTMPRKSSWKDIFTGQTRSLTAEDLARRFLFSVHTRHYLRRRVWRYFRSIGKENPQRYLAAMQQVLRKYDDADMMDGLSLLDNWGLIHILFHHSDVLVARAHGWSVKPNQSLAQLAPAPAYPEVWNDPLLLMGLVQEVRCRPVRQWAAKLLKRMTPESWNRIPLEMWLKLLESTDADVSSLAAEVLQQATGLESVSVEQWMTLLKSASPEVLDVLTGLIARQVNPATLSFQEIITLATQRAVLIARLGMRWLEARSPTTPEECRMLLSLGEAESDAIRAELVRLARTKLSSSELFQSMWLLEFFDSRHAEVRAEAWAWYDAESRAQQDVELWKKLLESPYDDVRLRLISELQKLSFENPRILEQRESLATKRMHLVWAAVLLNTQRGNRTKPIVVSQMVRRLTDHPDEAEALLPILSVALRSIRGPEWRAGLAGLVELMDKQESLLPMIQKNFPDFHLQSMPV